MVGGLEALRRVAAVGLLALGSVVPHDGPFLPAPTDVTPVADTSLACLLTVGTATTDPALATSAARAIAVGYAATDCMPDEQLLAAAEARAAIPMDTATPTGTVGADDSSSSGDGSDDDSSSGSSSSGSSGGDFDSDDSLVPGTSVDPAPVDPAPVDPAPVDPAPVDPTTAAGALAWGAAAGVEDFDGTLSNWGVYDGVGHAGKGRRSPAAMNASGGILTITGDPGGTTGGTAEKLGRGKYGRREARGQAPAADPSHHPRMVLWAHAGE